MGLLEGLVESIFQPGVNKSLLIFTNVTFGCLALLLLFLGSMLDFNIHILFLFILGVCLWIAINWYIIESGVYNQTHDGSREVMDGDQDKTSVDESKKTN